MLQCVPAVCAGAHAQLLEMQARRRTGAQACEECLEAAAVCLEAAAVCLEAAAVSLLQVGAWCWGRTAAIESVGVLLGQGLLRMAACG
jgi:hypothetical protein